MGYTTVFDGQPEKQRQRTEERQKKKILAEILKSIIDSDPEDKLDLRDDFAKGKEAEMRKFLADYKKQVVLKKKKVNRTAAPLCYLLRSKLMSVVEKSYTKFEQEDFHKYIKAYAQCCDRLQESTPGKALLASFIENNSHFIHKYVLRESVAPEGVFQVGRKAASAIINIWKELATVHIKLRGRKSASLLVLSLQYISRLELLVVEITPRSLAVRRIEQFVSLNVEIITLKINPGLPPKKWAAWIQDGHAVSDVVDSITGIVEVVNFALSLKALIDADGSLESAQAWIGAVGSLADTLDAFGAIMGLAKKTLAKIGFVSAVIDIIGAGFDMRSMGRRNDYSAMVGYGMVGLGSAVIATGCFLEALAVGTSTTIVGLPLGLVIAIIGGVLIAAGWAIAIFSGDTDREVFVSHCLWGEDYGDGDDNPKWACGSFRSWKNNLDKQIKALFNLLAAFGLESQGYTKVRIYMGATQPNSKFYINVDARYNLGIKHRPKLVVDLKTRKMRQVGGDPADLNRVYFGKDKDGRQYIEVEADWPKGKTPENAIQHQSCSCKVYLDLNGDGKQRIPSSGSWVKHTIHRLNTVLPSKIVSSKNF